VELFQPQLSGQYARASCGRALAEYFDLIEFGSALDRCRDAAADHLSPMRLVYFTTSAIAATVPFQVYSSWVAGRCAWAASGGDPALEALCSRGEAEPLWALIAALTVFAAAFVLFVYWIFRSVTRLRARAMPVPGFPPWWAALCWFIPGVNLVFPYLLLLRWRARIDARAMLRSVIVLLWIIDVIFYATIAAGFFVPEASSIEYLVSAAGDGIGAIGLALTAAVVWGLGRRQATVMSASNASIPA
jgi:hypothetical protein